MKKFFASNEDFEKIISKNLKNIQKIENIKTGWTNFVFKVNSNNKTYFFRFPRNNFFSDALLKEYCIINYLKEKLSFQTPDLKIMFEGRRPYSIHEEVKGESLTSCFESLTYEQKEILSKDICSLLKELSLLKAPKSFQKVSNFLDDLSVVSGNNYDITNHNHLKFLEKKCLVFSHGDFNPGNLILRNGKLVAVIDFSFSGISSPLTDLSRICGRLPSDFSNMLVSNYCKIFNKEINFEQIEDLEKMWKYVEEKYVVYIKQHHKDIVLPKKLFS